MRRMFPVLLLCAACATTPQYGDPIQQLATAEERLQAGDVGAAEELLGRIDDDRLKGDHRERWLVARARVLELRKEWWAAFKVLKEFVKEHPFSRQQSVAREIMFRLGESLLLSDGGFLFFTSDKDDGIAVMEFFYTQFPDENQRMPDVLHALGEEAFRREQWELCIQRYRALIQDFSEPRNEWIDLASFRAALCHYYQLKGSDYDQVALTLAWRELGGYLESKPANPEFQRTAKAAHQEVTRWLAEKELRIARFYERIDKPEGRRLHLMRVRQYPGTPQAAEAEEELSAMPPPRAGGSR
jgi:outer membrane protein assembly factor BamD (BamD/ComL family)